MKDEEETALERHRIGYSPGGNVLDFVKQSESHGAYSLDQDFIIKSLKNIAKCEDKDSRELMLSLISQIERLNDDGDELRKRFETTSKALEKVNEKLKSD